MRGATVSFKDFTPGWSELHHFMGVNERPTAMPAMTFDAGGMGVRVWTVGQYVGPCSRRGGKLAGSVRRG